MTEAPEGFQLARFTGKYLNHVGPYYVRKLDDGFQVGLRVLDVHTNYVDIVHGGVLSTLADVVLSYQVYRAEDPPRIITTSNLTTNFVSAARLGEWLLGDAWIDRMGKRTAHVHGNVCCNDRVVLTMSGVFGIGEPHSA